MNKRELMQQKMQRQQAILTAARTAGRDMTEDEAREFNALQADEPQRRTNPRVEISPYSVVFIIPLPRKLVR